ncbi:NAC domain-containing protein 35-like [Tasmannia lanceolata]|uniref:NAC domain-containing protein 35-like n=1 Tax=Tasmannia lanceolata TaxID=3420 RepID=UPI0040634E7C
MAIERGMSHVEEKDEHENDVVMPGFRFHPTEEELVEFYLRRKMEGKCFNIELITFLDLYRYDPWELPALAAIGEKEWYFYVPRDRKYRNGDRPNRVTTSGYWKATGADRTIRNETLQSIGLKKTLVFYTGKAPKGIRTSWIMNEYRLPHHETDRYQKAEISLCRVYKRAGVEDRSPLPTWLPSKSRKHNSQGNQPTTTYQALTIHSQSPEMENLSQIGGNEVAPTARQTKEDGTMHHHPKGEALLVQNCTLFPPPFPAEELHRLVDYQHMYAQYPNQLLPPSSSSQQQLLPLNILPNSLPTLVDKLWDWNPITDANRDYTTFK